MRTDRAYGIGNHTREEEKNGPLWRGGATAPPPLGARLIRLIFRPYAMDVATKENLALICVSRSLSDAKLLPREGP